MYGPLIWALGPYPPLSGLWGVSGMGPCVVLDRCWVRKPSIPDWTCAVSHRLQAHGQNLFFNSGAQPQQSKLSESVPLKPLGCSTDKLLDRQSLQRHRDSRLAWPCVLFATAATRFWLIGSRTSPAYRPRFPSPQGERAHCSTAGIDGTVSSLRCILTLCIRNNKEVLF